jgi:hypothetical protein
MLTDVQKGVPEYEMLAVGTAVIVTDVVAVMLRNHRGLSHKLLCMYRRTGNLE